MATLNLDLVEACPLCGNIEDFKLITDAGEAGKLVKCVCGLRFAKERVKKEALYNWQRYYVPSAYGNNDFSHRFRQAHEDLVKIESFMETDSRNLFDVCAGSGAFMKCAKDRGWVVEGNDLSMMCCLLAWHKWNIKIMCCEVENFAIPKGGGINALTLCNAIEHLRFPVKELNTLNCNMAHRGIIFIRTPEYTDAELKEKHQLPLHFFDYDRFSLNRLLRDTGFEVLEYERIDDPPTMLMIGRKK